MLREQLKNIAFNFISIPANYQLLVEDYNNEQVIFMWGTDDLNEGIEVSLDQSGKLITLSRPTSITGNILTTEQRKTIAQKFLTEQYADSLDYLTLSTFIEKEDATRFIYEQYVGGYPLANFYTKVIVSKYGEVIDFKYGGYTITPPTFPEKLANKQTILQHVQNAPWSLTLRYLNTEYYSVPVSGLYPIYESSIVYETFDAQTGQTTTEGEMEIIEQEDFIPFPQVAPIEKHTTLEEIIGIPDTMEKLRETGLEGEIGIVWRERNWLAPQDKSIDNFLLERMEDTVKVKVDSHTNELKEFIWFKERTGELALSFEACRDIACTFLTTYFPQYIPYLQLKVTAPEFNEVHRAFFSFPLHDGIGQIIDGEKFYVAVNRTTGLIDLLWGPKIHLAIIKAYEPALVQPIKQIVSAIDDMDTFLKWSRKYEDENSKEVLQFGLGHAETKQRILGIDAVSGNLIVSKL